MKAKRLTAIALSFALGCGALIACGNDPAPTNGTTVPATPDPGKIVTKPVDNETWVKAWDLGTITDCTLKYSETYVSGNNKTERSNGAVMLDGDKMYAVSSKTASSGEKQEDKFYYEKKGTEYFRYDYADGEWDRWGDESADGKIYNLFTYLPAEAQLLTTGIAGEYDAAASAYVLTQGTSIKYTIKIADEKLRYVKVEVKATDTVTVVMEYNLFNYGSTTVTLPVISSGGGGSVEVNNGLEGEKWRAVFALDGFDSLTYELTETSSGGVPQETTYKVDRNKKILYMITEKSGEVTYEGYSYDDGTEFKYMQRSNGNVQWSTGTHTATFEQFYAQKALGITYFAGVRDKFTYRNGKYVATNTTAEDYPVIIFGSAHYYDVQVNSAEIEINGNMLESIKLDVVVNGHSYVQEYRFYDYNSTQVSVPQIENA